MKTITFPDDCVSFARRHHAKGKGKGCVRFQEKLHLKFTQSGRLVNDNDDPFEQPYPEGSFQKGDVFDSGKVIKLGKDVHFIFVTDDLIPHSYSLTPKEKKDCDEDPEHPHPQK